MIVTGLCSLKHNHTVTLQCNCCYLVFQHLQQLRKRVLKNTVAVPWYQMVIPWYFDNTTFMYHGVYMVPLGTRCWLKKKKKKIMHFPFEWTSNMLKKLITLIFPCFCELLVQLFSNLTSPIYHQLVLFPNERHYENSFLYCFALIPQ